MLVSSLVGVMFEDIEGVRTGTRYKRRAIAFKDIEGVLTGTRYKRRAIAHRRSSFSPAIVAVKSTQEQYMFDR